MKKKLLLVLALLVFAVPAQFSNMSHVEAAGNEAITTSNLRHTEYEWMYKIVDGKLYKALMNMMTGNIETEWIYVRDM